MNDQARDFEKNTRNRLRSLESGIDSASLARLATARARALDAPVGHLVWPGRSLLAGAAMAAVLIFKRGLLHARAAA